MIENEYKVGQIVTGCVTGIEKYGIFVNLDNSYSGLIHISEISNSFVRNINDYVNVGENVKAKITDINQDKHQIKLSIKDMNYRESKNNNRRIIETKNGFTTLNCQLKIWIETKKNELLAKKI